MTTPDVPEHVTIDDVRAAGAELVDAMPAPSIPPELVAASVDTLLAMAGCTPGEPITAAMAPIVAALRDGLLDAVVDLTTRLADHYTDLHRLHVMAPVDGCVLCGGRIDSITLPRRLAQP